MNNQIDLDHICYVLVQIDVIHPIAHKKHELIWYPERGMTLLDCVQYIPYVKSIVTENPWLISCYSGENVRVWDSVYGWSMPNSETYGASVNYITMQLLGIRQTISSVALDGGESIKSLIKKLKEERGNYK